MFGLSFTEIFIIAALALILLGPDNLPDAARTIGKGLREFRRATEDLKDQIETELYTDELKRRQLPVAPVPAARAPASGPASEASTQGSAALPAPVSVPEYLPGLTAPQEPPAPVELAPAPSRPDEPGGSPRS